MKRGRPAKRRDRISGKGSPYAKYNKKPYPYSEGLRAWERRFTKKERERPWAQ